MRRQLATGTKKVISSSRPGPLATKLHSGESARPPCIIAGIFISSDSPV